MQIASIIIASTLAILFIFILFRILQLTISLKNKSVEEIKELTDGSKTTY